MKRQMILGLGALLLAECTATYPFTRNHTLEPQQFYADRYSCLLAARQGVVFGSPLFVAMHQNQLYLPCMQARGWYIPVPKSTP